MLKNITDLNKYKDRKEYDTFMCFTTKNRQHEEYQYLNLLQDILDNGHYENGRNGITKCVFGSAMHFSLENGKIPILTTKKTAWKTCLKELLWFIKGQTDNKILNNQKVHIWDGNSTKEFMKSRDLEHYKEGDLGPIYGYQWRHFNATYNSCDADYTNNGIDQLQEVIECLNDLRKVGVNIVTFGQYLRPTKNHLPVDRYVTPTEFDEFKSIAYEMGFDFVASGPLVRSSYKAADYLDHLEKKGLWNQN